MSKDMQVSAQIEILASPEAVREVFLNFPEYHKWQTGWKVTPKQEGKDCQALEVGDGLKVNMHGLRFSPFVEENSPECFSWGGTVLLGTLTGKHDFFFYPSKENVGGTLFIQRERFTGALTVPFRPWVKTDQPSENWVTFNAALKKEAERLMVPPI